MAHYERPSYEVIKKEGKYEIRRYAPYTLVQYQNSKDPAVQMGFRTLFSYISKGNQEEKKISMTVPVFERSFSKESTMAFVVPKAEASSPPKPSDQHLKIVQVPGGLYGVLQYGGRTNQEKEREILGRLEAWLGKSPYRIIDDPLLARYNPPFIPGIFHRNEILLALAEEE